MVSPVDKNNGDIRALLDNPSYPTALTQSSTDGNKLTYSSYRGFGKLKAAPYTNQYIASRKDGVGWSSEALNLRETSDLDFDDFENHFKAFTADLCLGFSMFTPQPSPDPAAPPGYRNIYRHDSCGGKDDEALIHVQPTTAPGPFMPLLQGLSADGGEAVFMAEDALAEGAVSGPWQTYYASKGELHLLCVGPNGAPTGSNCSTGTASVGSFLQHLSTLTRAISADGNRVYWTDSAGTLGPGKVYLRLNPSEDQSEVSGGQCTEPEKACTLKVSETKTTQPARLLAESDDGVSARFAGGAGG